MAKQKVLQCHLTSLPTGAFLLHYTANRAAIFPQERIHVNEMFSLFLRYIYIYILYV